MKIKTSKLTGAALDWAVAKCEADPLAPVFIIEEYSTDWAQGGPIIEREAINTRVACGVDIWEAETWTDGQQFFAGGSTPLIAAMRCYVASKLGDEVGVPEELLGGTNPAAN